MFPPRHKENLKKESKKIEEFLSLIKEAEQKGIEIIKDTEKKAKALEHKLQKENEEKQLQMQKDTHEQLKKQLEENKKVVLVEAAALVRKTIIKTVELKPDAIDEALIKKAVGEITNES